MTENPIVLLEQLKMLVGQLKLAAEKREGENLPKLVEAYLDVSAKLLQSRADSEDEVEKQNWGRLAVEVLQLQRDVEAVATPWMDDLRILLRENRQGQVLGKTYRAEP